MWNDYLELPQVKFLIEHWAGCAITFIGFALFLYVCTAITRYYK